MGSTELGLASDAPAAPSPCLHKNGDCHPASAILGPFWARFGPFWSIGPLWAILAILGHFGPFGAILAIWGHFGPQKNFGEKNPQKKNPQKKIPKKKIGKLKKKNGIFLFFLRILNSGTEPVNNHPDYPYTFFYTFFLTPGGQF